jgi:hypothetical protein
MTKASRQEHRSSPRYGAGVLASLIAESVFLLMMAGIAWLRGMDPWRVTRMPATFIIGPDAVEPSGFVPEDVLLGLAMHLILSILVGLLYAFLLPRLGLSPLAGGVLTGILLYSFGSWILPLLFPNWLAPLWLPPAGKVLQLVTHMIYGVVFGLTFHRLTR